MPPCNKVPDTRIQTDLNSFVCKDKGDKELDLSFLIKRKVRDSVS